MNQVSVREALFSAMKEEMERDENVFVIGEEVAEYRGAYKVTQNLFEIFNKNVNFPRVIDTPITEHGFAGIGIGAALAGLRPIVEFMTFNFALQAVDQIINSAAKTKYMSGGQVECPIVFRGPNGMAARVGAQHSQSFGSLYAHIPGLKVIAPYFAADCRGLLKSAIRDNNPIIFLEHELVYGEKHDVPEEYSDENYLIKIGKARVIKEGTDLTIIGYSRMIKWMLEADKELSDSGINAELIDLRTLRPLDTETIINSVKKTNRVVIVDEEWPYASIASEIIAVINDLAFDYLDAPVVRINAIDVPLPYAANLEKLAAPQTRVIIGKVKDLMSNKI